MYRKLLLIIAGIYCTAIVIAQSPDLYPPTVPKAVDVNLFNIILYIVLPVALVAAFFMYQRSQKKKQNQKMKDREKGTKKK